MNYSHILRVELLPVKTVRTEALVSIAARSPVARIFLPDFFANCEKLTVTVTIIETGRDYKRSNGNLAMFESKRRDLKEKLMESSLGFFHKSRKTGELLGMVAGSWWKTCNIWRELKKPKEENNGICGRDQKFIA